MMLRFASIAVVVLSLVVLTQAQSLDNRTLKPGFSSNKPIIFGSETDSYPAELNITGKIVAVGDQAPACGTLATAGTLRIKLETPNPIFRKGFINLVVFCLKPGSGKSLRNKSISLKAKKLTTYPYEFGVYVDNDFDSEGEPFYLANGGGFGELKKFLK